MKSIILFKNTVLFCFVILFTSFSLVCNAQDKSKVESRKSKDLVFEKDIRTGADQTELYIPLLEGKRVGVLTNQTGIVHSLVGGPVGSDGVTPKETYILTESLVDVLIRHKIDLKKIYAPEHGFRGTADAGELIKDGKDTKTGLPIISLYGNNKKPTKAHLEGIDVMIFDLQDVGARFYTYISSLHYLMEACAENNIPVIVLDRPNPNGGTIDGPALETAHQSFVGMHPIPVLHGMTIGEYAQMINGEKWLKNGVVCDLTVIPCAHYDKSIPYSLPVKPSPNLPNDQSINLYASLCFFEGTHVSMGRGTDKQFQIYGSPWLRNMPFSFTPKPNDGAKDPVHNGKKCYGEDLSEVPEIKGINLEWLIKAYRSTPEEQQSKFFNNFFAKLAGTNKLRSQIEKGMTAEDIRRSWQGDLAQFEKTRKKYLIYPDEK